MKGASFCDLPFMFSFRLFLELCRVLADVNLLLVGSLECVAQLSIIEIFMDATGSEIDGVIGSRS